MSWLENLIQKTTSTIAGGTKHEIPEGVWTKCTACDQVLYRAELERNLNVCPKCGHHMHIKARVRLDNFLDKDGREELAGDLEPKDILKFKDLKKYKDRYTAAQKKSGEKDGLVVIKGTLKGLPVVACAFEFEFMAGSMGSVVGARFCAAVEECLKTHRALICFATSGGARMQESLFSLMQMAKTSAAAEKLRAAGVPYIAVPVNPTTGGVTASFAMLGDIIVSEPKAMIGFAGRRVIEQTIKQKLPEEFQTSEFLLKCGMVDVITKREDMKATLHNILSNLVG